MAAQPLSMLLGVARAQVLFQPSCRSVSLLETLGARKSVVVGGGRRLSRFLGGGSPHSRAAAAARAAGEGSFDYGAGRGGAPRRRPLITFPESESGSDASADRRDGRGSPWGDGGGGGGRDGGRDNGRGRSYGGDRGPTRRFGGGRGDGFGGRSGRPPRSQHNDVKPGDWRCPCGFNNFASRADCRKCGGDRASGVEFEGDPSADGTPYESRRGQPGPLAPVRWNEIRAGDWRCPCGFNNFGSRDDCKQCGGGRAAGVEATDADADAGEGGGEGRTWREYGGRDAVNGPRANDWSCACGFVNFAARRSCRECGASAEDATGTVGEEMGGVYPGSGAGKGARPLDWRCAACTFANFSSRAECRECGGPRTVGDAIPAVDGDAINGGGRPSDEGRERPRGMSRGDWSCACGFANFASRRECRECGAARPTADSSVDVDVDDSDSAAPASGDSDPGWECEECAASNAHSRPQCRSCGGWRDGPSQERAAAVAALASSAAVNGPAAAAAAGRSPPPEWLERALVAREEPPTARGEAVRQLLRVEAGAFVGLAARHSAGGGGGGIDLDPRAARRATELCAGITRRKKYLDWLLSCFYTGGKGGEGGGAASLDDLEPPLRAALRLGLYELVVDGTEPHAAVNEAVDIVKRITTAGGGLANAVLRAAATAVESGAVPTVPMPPESVIAASAAAAAAADGGGKEGKEAIRAVARALATAHSHPAWLVGRWLRRWGRVETESLLRVNNARHPVYALRANSARGQTTGSLGAALTAAGVQWAPSKWLPHDFLVLPGGGLQAVAAAGLLSSGACAVQDESAGMVVSLLGPLPGEVVADVCAAPGGKALFAASRMVGDAAAAHWAKMSAGAEGGESSPGRLVAVDARRGRLAAVAAGAEALGVGKVVETVAADARDWAQRNVGLFDRVLVDAPCTGLGVLAKRADLRWRRAPSDLAALPKLQAELLAAGALAVKPGGLLVYSTCTTEPEECGAVVASFLATHPAFALESAAGLLPPEAR